MARMVSRPWRHVGIAAWALAIVLVGSAAIGVIVGEATVTGRIGVYRGAATPRAVRQFERWLGRPTSFAVDFLEDETWAHISHPSWWAERWAGTNRRIVYSVPLLPESGGSLREGAAGKYNHHFRHLATVLVLHGQGDAVLRLGWEFNAPWFRWAAEENPQAFAAYWREIVDTMRAVPGARFEFDWCPVLGRAPFRVERAWPGDDYVDYVGLDVYDQGWGGGWDEPDPVRRWRQARTDRYGLRWHRDFAARHGKPMSFPEWALVERDNGLGGGDNPYFVERMHRWIEANNVAYHAYFDFDAPDGRHRLSDGQFPRSGRRFVALFGDA